VTPACVKHQVRKRNNEVMPTSITNTHNSTVCQTTFLHTLLQATELSASQIVVIDLSGTTTGDTHPIRPRTHHTSHTHTYKKRNPQHFTQCTVSNVLIRPREHGVGGDVAVMDQAASGVLRCVVGDVTATDGQSETGT